MVVVNLQDSLEGLKIVPAKVREGFYMKIDLEPKVNRHESNILRIGFFRTAKS
jgi:hypothetical protein